MEYVNIYMNYLSSSTSLQLVSRAPATLFVNFKKYDIV